MGKINFNNIFSSTQYIQNINISTHNQYKNSCEVFYSFTHIKALKHNIEVYTYNN